MSFVDLNDSIIAQVREAADIVDFVSQVTPLKAAGKNFKGLCPFHREKTPSFNVDRSRGFFYCFGCGTGGDVFKFVMLTERFNFPEAVEFVAGRVGITLPRKTSSVKRDTDRELLLEVLDEASAAFHQALGWVPNPADEYLKKREISKEIRSSYGFGYAPDAWDYLLTRLGRKYDAERLEKAGLILPRKTGNGHYDRFRNRLMIPIHNEGGSVIGFGGRTLDGSDPKYLNSPESEVFNKSTLLYNLHRAKQSIRRLDRAILVEGYFDCIALDANGIHGAVASMGTSLTPGQASLIARYTKRVIVCYDGDSAGRNATLKAAPVLLSAGLNVEVLNVGEGDDPDTFIRKHGADAFVEALAGTTELIDFALSAWIPDPGALTSSEKAQKLDALTPLLVAMQGVLRNDAAQKVADWLRLQFDVVWSRLRGSGGASRQAEPTRSGTANNRNVNGEKHLLAAIVQEAALGDVVDRLREDYFRDASCRAIFRELAELRRRGTVDYNTLGTRLRGEKETETLAEIVHWEQVLPDSLEQIIAPMERQYLEERLSEVQRRIQQGEGDPDALFEEKMQLMKEIKGQARPAT
jgi:DNA primase